MSLALPEINRHFRGSLGGFHLQRDDAGMRREVVQARVDALRSDPKIVQLAYSGLLCGWTDDYNAAIHEVGEYHKAAKIGGVLDLGEVNRWQDEALRARRHQATARAELKQAKLKPLPCKDPTVAKIAHCITDEVRGAAECEGTQDYVLVAGGE